MNYLIDLIIRPTRNVYSEKDLGDRAFTFSGQDFKRIDFNTQIKNNRGERISCSFWCPLEMSSKELAFSPCIIYSHGNAGNKIDIIEIFEFLLWDFNICSFDFSGAGLSDGDFVTLGYYEKDDIKAVVEFLRNELNIQKIILYGRSMGAVSSLRYAESDPNLKAIVLDSPFSNFPKLCEEILSNKFYLPNVVSSFLISMAHDRILGKVENFNIYDFTPYKNAKQVQVPTLLIHGIQDSLVGVEHSRIIFKNLHKNTYKKLLEVEGEHNDCRSPTDVSIIRNFIMQFAYDSLIIKEHQRRLNIKNAHFNYTTKYGININSIVSNFRNSIKSQYENNEKLQLINYSAISSSVINNLPKESDKLTINNAAKQERRKMNNFNIYGTIKKSKIIGSSSNLYNSLDKLRSKSSDNNEDEVLTSNIKKQDILINVKGKVFKRDTSNNMRKSEHHNASSNNIKMIKYHEFVSNRKESEMKKKKKAQEKKEDTKLINSNSLNKAEDFSTNMNELNTSFIVGENVNNNINTSCNVIQNSTLSESQLQVDSLSPKRNNLSFNAIPFSHGMMGKGRLRSERNNIVGGILGCEVRVKSDQFKLIDLDKTSMRKKSTADFSVIQSDLNISSVKK